MSSTFTLYLIPTVLAEGTASATIPADVIQTIRKLGVFFVENIRTARRFISSLKLGIVIDDLEFVELNKDTPPHLIKSRLENLQSDAGVISEAGVPCVADPGSIAVACAHQLGFRVRPLVGPSSILMALMGSGFSGQSFAFTGYLPIERPARAKAILHMEKLVMSSGQTQIFMETPYRNNQLLQSLLETCNPGTRLCVAANITGPDELILTQTIAQWRRNPPDLNRRPTIFLLGNLD